MQIEEYVDVTAYGAVILGPNIVCDGFFYGPKARVQSHIHKDHMQGFDTSKGTQKIITSKATHDMISLSRDADIPYRGNIIGIDDGESYNLEGDSIKLLNNNHMLGSVQTQVNINDLSVGYSGDFDWPVYDIIDVDILVVDSTYGSPYTRREYTQKEVEERFLELLSQKINQGPILLKAHRETLERALSIIDYELETNIIASPETCEESEIYRKYGYSIPDIIRADNDESEEVMQSNDYIYIVRRGEKGHPLRGNITNIVLSAYMGNPNNPLEKYSSKSYRVAMTTHADFNGTISYIQEVDPKLVITDNCRGGHAIELSNILNSKYEIEAKPSTNTIFNPWRNTNP